MEYLAIVLTLTAVSSVFGGIEQCPLNIQDRQNVQQFGTSCYEFVLNHPVDWQHADQDCKTRGGYLIDIHSTQENYFVYKTLRDLGYVRDEGVWIGLTDVEKENNWHWSHTGIPLDFKNWAPSQPGLLGTFEDCVIMQGSDGKWHDYPCSGFLFSTEKHGWVCKYDAAAPIATATIPMATATIPIATATIPIATATTIKPLVVSGYTLQVLTGNRMTTESPEAMMTTAFQDTDNSTMAME